MRQVKMKPAVGPTNPFTAGNKELGFKLGRYLISRSDTIANKKKLRFDIVVIC